jgi:hypothetical protein
MKYLVNEKYRGNIHYVWCSETFDATTLGAYVSGSIVPPSSNPKDILFDLKKAVESTDTHNAKIKEQMSGLAALAVKWEKAGEISTADKDDIVYMVNELAYFKHWRPLLYLIPRAPVESRIVPVAAAKCASLGKEYIISDLRRDEFEILEL